MTNIEELKKQLAGLEEQEAEDLRQEQLMMAGAIFVQHADKQICSPQWALEKAKIFYSHIYPSSSNRFKETAEEISMPAFPGAIASSPSRSNY